MAMYPTPSVACEEGEQSERVWRFRTEKKNNPNMTYGAKLSDAMLYLEKEKKMDLQYRTSKKSDNKQEERSAVISQQQTWWTFRCSWNS